MEDRLEEEMRREEKRGLEMGWGKGEEPWSGRGWRARE